MSSLAVLAAAAAARAEPAPPFATLLSQSLAISSRLAESDAEVDRVAGIALQTRARLNPSVSIYAENVVGTGSYADLAGQTTLQFDQPLELFGKRSARIAAGAASLEAARALRTQGRVVYGIELANRFATAEAAARRITLSEENLALAEEDLRIARALVTSGKEAAVRSVQAEAEVGTARARVGAARTALTQALADLTAYAGAPAPLTSVPDDLLASTDTPTPPVSTIDVTASPAYLTASADREAAARQVRVQRLAARPNPTVSVGVRQIARDDFAGVVGLALPIPVFDQNRGNIAAAQAVLRAADARLRTVRIDLEAATSSALARLSSSQSQLDAAKQAEAAAAETYRLTRLGWSGGKLSQLEVVTARRAYTDAQSQTIDARLALLTARAQLSQLAGRTPFGDRS